MKNSKLLTKERIVLLEGWFIQALLKSPLIDGFDFEEVRFSRDASVQRTVRTSFTPYMKQKQADFSVGLVYTLKQSGVVDLQVIFTSGTHPSLSYSTELLIVLDDFKDCIASLTTELTDAIKQLEDLLSASLIDFIDYKAVYFRGEPHKKDYLMTFIFVSRMYNELTHRITIRGDLTFRIQHLFDESQLARGMSVTTAYSDFEGQFSKDEQVMILTSCSTGVYVERGIIPEPTRRNIMVEFLYFIREHTYEHKLNIKRNIKD